MNKKDSNKKIFGFLIAIILVFSSVFIHLYLLGPVSVSAQSSSIPFGGPIMSIIRCTCNQGNSVLVTIYDYKDKETIKLVYAPPFSKLFKWYNLFTPFVMTLGTYQEDGPDCKIRIKDSCITLSSDGTIDSNPGVGTGATPAF